MISLLLVYAYEEEELDYKVELNRSIRIFKKKDPRERPQILTSLSTSSAPYTPGNWWITESATRFLKAEVVT